MHRRFKNNLRLSSMCYIEDGNPNPGGAGGMPAPNAGGQQNNAGTPDPLLSFWNEPAPEPTNPGITPTPTPTPSQAPGAFAEVRALMEGFKPASFMDAKVIGEMGENKFESFNAGLEQHGKQVLEQSAGMMTGILKEIVPQIFAQVQQMMDSKFTATDNSKFIADNIPQSKDPRLAKQVKDVFDQAMKHSKNDKTAALALANSMLGAMGTAFVPNDPNSGNPPLPGGGRAKIDWFDELGVHMQD
jgi:hypothetical protein